LRATCPGSVQLFRSVDGKELDVSVCNYRPAAVYIVSGARLKPTEQRSERRFIHSLTHRPLQICKANLD